MAPGFGPYWVKGGQVEAEGRAISGDELDNAYRNGLVGALNRKSKLRVDGRGHTLLIWARECHMAMQFRVDFSA